MGKGAGNLISFHNYIRLLYGVADKVPDTPFDLGV